MSKCDKIGILGKSAKGDEPARAFKAADLDNLRKSIAKHSLDVKFDLNDTDYKPIENIGIGAYGVVCSAVHRKSGDRVAIKKIPNVFDALTIAKRTYREIKILKHFKHDNIICIREILLPKENAKDFKDIYVVFDLMESDLHRIIYSEQELSDEHIRYFLYQILRGLKYIHSANVIHRDLKPSNLLVNEDCHLRIGDFGMARGVCYTPNEPSYYMTQYVATRWYRAPEILLSMLEYGEAADMWSVGCIFAEMIGRKHLFPGKDYISQVKLIIGVLGTPSETLLNNCQNEILRKIIKSCAKKEPVSWDKLFPKTSKKSLELLSRMLVLNPADRITVGQALSHRLLNNYHDPDDEPICVPTFNFDFEKKDLDKTQLRTSIMDEIMGFHQPKPPTLSFNACLRPAPKAEEAASKQDKTGDQGIFVNEAITFDLSRAEPDFKTPYRTDLLKPPTKVSPVSVDIGKLRVSQSSDIEMLSAQSADGRVMDTRQSDDQEGAKVEEVKKENLEEKAAQEKDSRPDKKGGNTISEDTRARVKQALMNANTRKQRAESQSEEVKEVKHVTAAQRQKEREEKRRKKKERALEKVKKTKEKKGLNQEQTITLSSQDMELLRRWTVMQKPGQQSDETSPPHPGPSGTPPQTGSNPAGRHPSVDAPLDQAPGQQTFIGNKPRQILAKGTISSTTVTFGSSTSMAANQISSGTVLFPSGINLVQTTFIPVLAFPSIVNPGRIEIKRIFHASDLAPQVCTSGMQASDSTKNLLQNAILMRNQSLSAQNVQPQVSANTTVPKVESYSPPAQSSQERDFNTEGRSVLSSSPLPQCSLVSPSGQFASSALGHINRESNGLLKEDKLSPRSQGNDLLDFLDQHLKDSPKPPSGCTSSLQSDYSVGSHMSAVQDSNNSYVGDSSHHMTPPPQVPFSSYSDIHSHEEQLTRSNSTPSLLRSHAHSTSNIGQENQHAHRSSVPFSSFDNNNAGSSAFSDQGSTSLNFQSHDNVKFYHSVEAPSFQENFGENVPGYSQNVIGYDSAMPMFNSTSDFSSQGNQHQLHNQHKQHHLDSLQQTHPDQLHSHQETHNGQNQHQYSNQILQQHQMYGSANSFHEYHNFSETPAAAPVSFEPDFNSIFPSSQTQQYPSRLGQFQPPAACYSSATGQSQAPVHQLEQQNHIVEPSSVGPFASFAESQNSLHSGPSSSGSSKLRINCSQPVRSSSSDMELMAIINRLSRSQMGDSFPPALALTPKGTGAGYGVGMDLDSMLIDAQDLASLRPDQSPLSSSLLADWLDISGISQADLDALAQEMSPMHVSYSDMNM